MSTEDKHATKKVNIFDQFTSKLEAGIVMVQIGFYVLTGLIVADFGSTILWSWKADNVLPNEILSLWIFNLGLLIGWVINRKESP